MSRDDILLRNKNNGSFRSHQLSKSESPNISNSSKQIKTIKRVLEKEHLKDWELEKLFKMVDK